ncbi:GNAT family N-acetyltransferase [bacterium]|jgi:ribosomal protein S18 acetylase RimI-like enzyme|nr:GNAT family N-acetyltransferase [bacterium]MBT5015466.1 GNAT family N-acetyltransferase [bacterium]
MCYVKGFDYSLCYVMTIYNITQIEKDSMVVNTRNILFVLLLLGTVQGAFSVLDMVDRKGGSRNVELSGRKIVDGFDPQHMASILEMCRSNHEALQEDPQCVKFRHMLAQGQKKAFCSVVEENGTPKGFLFGFKPSANVRDPKEGCIHHLAVSQENRHQGLGSLLLSDAESKIKSMGGSKVSLILSKSNTSAFRLYVKGGYKVDMTMVQLLRDNDIHQSIAMQKGLTND